MHDCETKTKIKLCILGRLSIISCQSSLDAIASSRPLFAKCTYKRVIAYGGKNRRDCDCGSATVSRIPLRVSDVSVLNASLGSSRAIAHVGLLYMLCRSEIIVTYTQRPLLALLSPVSIHTQSLAFLAVFVYATHATQAIAFEWKPGFTVFSQYNVIPSVMYNVYQSNRPTNTLVITMLLL